MINVILQFLGLELSDIQLSAKFYQNIPNGLKVKFHLFQSLILGKTSTNPKCHLTINGYILSIPMCMQNFITIFYSVQEIEPFSLFRIWSSEEPRPMKRHFAISWAKSCQYRCLRNCLSKCSTQFKRYGHFHFFRNWRSAKPRPMINVILQFLDLELVNINVSAKFYQNIPNGLRVKFHCIQNLNLGITSTNPKCHLTISWATSCQYQYACKILSQYATQFNR